MQQRSEDNKFSLIPLKNSGTSGDAVQAQGKMVNQYVVEHQDRSKNSMMKSMEAAFLAWCEDVKSDETQFTSDLILLLGCHGAKPTHV